MFNLAPDNASLLTVMVIRRVARWILRQKASSKRATKTADSRRFRNVRHISILGGKKGFFDMH